MQQREDPSAHLIQDQRQETQTPHPSALVADLNDLAVKTVHGAMVYIRDVAHAADGSPPQTNIVRVDGRLAVLMNVMKMESASTLDIIRGVRERLKAIRGRLPQALQITGLSDQSIFVRAAISGVVLVSCNAASAAREHRSTAESKPR